MLVQVLERQQMLFSELSNDKMETRRMEDEEDAAYYSQIDKEVVESMEVSESVSGFPAETEKPYRIPNFTPLTQDDFDEDLWFSME